jgi:hypothetical protein
MNMIAVCNMERLDVRKNQKKMRVLSSKQNNFNAIDSETILTELTPEVCGHN